MQEARQVREEETVCLASAEALGSDPGLAGVGEVKKKALCPFT